MGSFLPADYYWPKITGCLQLATFYSLPAPGRAPRVDDNPLPALKVRASAGRNLIAPKSVAR